MVTVKTNSVPRDIVYGFELSEKEKKEFDYLTEEELNNGNFFRYKGWTYDMGDFLIISEFAPKELLKWDGHHFDTYFSGVVVRYVENFERIIVGRYYS